ncbi:MAG: hypothetical protein WBI40_09290 [Methylococcaceae bacterium]
MRFITKKLDLIINKLIKLNNFLKIKFPDKKANALAKQKMMDFLDD